MLLTDVTLPYFTCQSFWLHQNGQRRSCVLIGLRAEPSPGGGAAPSGLCQFSEPDVALWAVLGIKHNKSHLRCTFSGLQSPRIFSGRSTYHSTPKCFFFDVLLLIWLMFLLRLSDVAQKKKTKKKTENGWSAAADTHHLQIVAPAVLQMCACWLSWRLCCCSALLLVAVAGLGLLMVLMAAVCVLLTCMRCTSKRKKYGHAGKGRCLCESCCVISVTCVCWWHHPFWLLVTVFICSSTTTGRHRAAAVEDDQYAANANW